VEARSRVPIRQTSEARQKVPRLFESDTSEDWRCRLFTRIPKRTKMENKEQSGGSSGSEIVMAGSGQKVPSHLTGTDGKEVCKEKPEPERGKTTRTINHNEIKRARSLG